jgi:hypothetical protein
MQHEFGYKIGIGTKKKHLRERQHSLLLVQMIDIAASTKRILM